MKINWPTRKARWPHDLIWLVGVEAAATLAVVLAVPFLIKRIATIRRDADGFEQMRAADLFSVSIEASANADVAHAFAVIVPIDVPSIMPGYGPLPAVVGVEAQTGNWDAIGQTRTVRLADGTTAREEITLHDAPHRFAYTVRDWSGMMRFLAREAKSEWRFSEVAAGQTRVEWRYAFTPRGVLAALPLVLIVQGLWRGTMKQALRECVRQAEDYSSTSASQL